MPPSAEILRKLNPTKQKHLGFTRGKRENQLSENLNLEQNGDHPGPQRLRGLHEGEVRLQVPHLRPKVLRQVCTYSVYHSFAQ